MVLNDTASPVKRSHVLEGTPGRMSGRAYCVPANTMTDENKMNSPTDHDQTTESNDGRASLVRYHTGLYRLGYQSRRDVEEGKRDRDCGHFSSWFVAIVVGLFRTMEGFEENKLSWQELK